LKKTEIAYRIAHSIDEDLKKTERTIQIPTNDINETVNYLINAIKYAAGD